MSNVVVLGYGGLQYLPGGGLLCVVLFSIYVTLFGERNVNDIHAQH